MSSTRLSSPSRVSEGKNAKPISKIKISLPSGISFSSSSKNLKKGIHVTGGGKVAGKVSNGVLTIILSSAATSAKVTLASPAITVSTHLASTVNKLLKKHKVKWLTFKLTLTDSGGTATKVSQMVTPKS